MFAKISIKELLSVFKRLEQFHVLVYLTIVKSKRLQPQRDQSRSTNIIKTCSLPFL